MNLSSIAILVTLAAAFSGWLQSGSVIPMVISLLILSASFTASVFPGRASPPVKRTTIHFTPWILTGVSLYLAIRMDQARSAVDSSPSLSTSYHLGISLLWWLSSDLIFRSTLTNRVLRNHQALVGLTGGLLLVSASVTNSSQILSQWILLPLAALPLATCAARALFPALSSFKTLVLVILPASLAMAGLILTASKAAEVARIAFDSENPDLPSVTLNAPSSEENSPEALDRASRRLPREGDIRFTGKVMVFLRAHSPDLFRSWRESPLYARTYSLSIFESDEVISAIRSGRWIYDLDDGNEDNSVTLQSSDAPLDAHYTAYVSRSSAGHLPILNSSAVLHASAVYEFADSWYQLTPPDNVTHLQYKSSANSPANFDERQVLDLGDLRQENAPVIYLNLPPSPLSSRIRELSSGFSASDPLGSIREYLRENASYSLRFSTPENSSPVEEFFFGSRKGHCEHYATATVLLLRSLGIPSRIAYGYAGGTADTRQQLVAFRDSDFHAWAEILSPDQKSWIIFDTTPNASGPVARLPTPANLPVVDETVYHNFSAMSPNEAFAPEGFDEEIAAILGVLSQHFLAASTLGLVIVVILSRVLARQGGRNVRFPADSSPPESRPPSRPRFIDELIAEAMTLGIHRKPGHTLKDLISGISRHRTLPEEMETAVSYYYSVSYGGRDPDPVIEAHYLNLVREWGQSIRSN